MAEPAYPKSAQEVVEILGGLYRHAGDLDKAQLFETGVGRMETVGWTGRNESVAIWGLFLEVPLEMFARHQHDITGLEAEIAEMMAKAFKPRGDAQLNGITIEPMAPGRAPKAAIRLATEPELARIWSADQFRLFLSHVSLHKVAIGKLKYLLGLRGVSAFVAHEDVEAMQEWQGEIEIALNSMHALAAVLTPEFHKSWYTDQEVGFALGRRVPIFPLRLGQDPYGFIGKIQAITCTLEGALDAADQLCAALLRNPTTHHEYRRTLLYGFRYANSFASASSMSRLIVTLANINDEEKVVLHEACALNNQVYNATGVVYRIQKAIGKPPALPAEAVAAVTDDDVPF